MREIQKPLTIEEKDDFKVIFSKYGAYALDKQENLENLVKDSKGTLNIDDGKLSFDNNIIFDVQILAFYSPEFNMWSWAWDNEDMDLNKKLLKDSFKIKEIGEKYNISEFTTPNFGIDFDDSHMISMVASSLLDSDAYYVANFEDLNVFVMIKSSLIIEDNSAERFRLTFNSFNKNFTICSRIAFEGYSKLKGYEYKDRDEFSLAKIGDNRVIAGFSEKGVLTHIQLLKAD